MSAIQNVSDAEHTARTAYLRNRIVYWATREENEAGRGLQHMISTTGRRESEQILYDMINRRAAGYTDDSDDDIVDIDPAPPVVQHIVLPSPPEEDGHTDEEYSSDDE